MHLLVFVFVFVFLELAAGQHHQELVLCVLAVITCSTIHIRIAT